jgi:LPXTG-motif cell wall-anchored protein
MGNSRVAWAASFAAAMLLVSLRAEGREAYMPSRRKDIDQVVTVGNEVGQMLDHAPREGEEVAPLPETGGRTTMGWTLVMVFSAIGTAYFIYGKKQGNLTVLVAGIGMMVFPYFVENAILTLVAGAMLCALPAMLGRLGVGQ